MRATLILFIASLVLFSAANYGGMRSPDSEIVFRVGESIAAGRGFAVQEDLALWKGFGVTPGRDGRQYAIFGPLESVAAAPAIAGAALINATRWYEHAEWLPVSFYSGRGLIDYLLLRRPADLEPHALRFVVSFMNALIAALCVLLFWVIARIVVRSPVAALLGALLYGCGTLLWPYAGTFFSEPLATLCILLSFLQLVASDPALRPEGGGARPHRLLLAGIFLGLAAAAHLTALLFLPFFALYAWHLRSGPGRSGGVLPLVLFAAGVAFLLMLLGAYNYIRFGNMLQTGRSVGMDSIVTTEYSRFVAPWRGLWGLLVSPGKGLLLYCPAVIAGLGAWRGFHRRHAFLSFMLAGAAVLRLLFIASRSDWHGGFSLGPRYLVMLIPFLLIPVLFWIEEQAAAGRARNIAVFIGIIFLCACQQAYFVLGELFSSYQLMKMKFAEMGINIFTGDRIYLEWQFSPLVKLWGARIAPFWLQHTHPTVATAWLAGVVLLALGLGVAARMIVRRLPAPGGR